MASLEKTKMNDGEKEYQHIVEIGGKYYSFRSKNPNLDEALLEAKMTGQTLWEYIEPWKRKFGIALLALGIIGLIAFPIIVFTFGTGEAYEVGMLVKGLIGSSICIGTGLQFNKFFHRITLI